MSISSGSVLRALSKHFHNTSTALKSSPGPRDSEWEQKPFIFVYGHNTATECRHLTAAALTLTVVVVTSSSSASSCCRLRRHLRRVVFVAVVINVSAVFVATVVATTVTVAAAS
jgi:hypothetical protein